MKKLLLIALLALAAQVSAQWHVDHVNKQASFKYKVESNGELPKTINFPMGPFQGKANIKYKDGYVVVYNMNWSGGIMLGGSGGNFTGYMDQVLWNKRGKYKKRYLKRYQKMLTRPLQKQIKFLVE